MHPNSLMLFETCVKKHFSPQSRVLEIGPDRFPSTHQISVGETAAWDTLDLYESPKLTYVADGEYDYPIPTDSYDIVISGQVIEHVRMPWVWMQEVARICRPGGLVITVCPVSWGFHECPIDCWRIYRDGMAALYEYVDLEVSFCETASLDGKETDTICVGVKRENRSVA